MTVIGETVRVTWTAVGDDGITPITGELDADFTATLLKPDNTVDGQTITIVETALAGTYGTAVVPSTLGQWTLVVTHIETGSIWHEHIDVQPTTSTSVWSATEGAFLYALARNKSITDPDTGVMTIYADDNITPLFTADIFRDADGTTPYSGTGVERREKFV